MRLSSFTYVALPNWRRAAARASSAVMPDANCSSCRNSKCRRTSSSRSASNCRRCISMVRRLASSSSQFITELLSDSLDHTRDRADDAFELRHLDGQLFAACCSQFVVTGAAVASRRAPLRGHPSLDEHPLQRGVQRSFFDLQNVIGYLLNGIGNLIPMHFAGARQRSQNEQIEGSRGNFVSMHGTTPDIVRLWQSRIACQGPASQVCMTMRHDNALRASGAYSLVSARKTGLPPRGSTMGKSATRTSNRFLAASCMGSVTSPPECSLFRSVCTRGESCRIVALCCVVKGSGGLSAKRKLRLLFSRPGTAAQDFVPAAFGFV